jgi:hypothetical protein
MHLAAKKNVIVITTGGNHLKHLFLYCWQYGNATVLVKHKDKCSSITYPIIEERKIL